MNYLRTAGSFLAHADRYPTLFRNWAYSYDTLSQLRERLSSALSNDIFSVALAGSFGRMEACPLSDVDYIVLAAPNRDITHDFQILREIAADLKLPDPKRDGVFSRASSLPQLIDSVGTSQEDLGILARRILLLMESRPVFNDSNFLIAVNSVFDLYANQVRRDPSKHFVFLLNDLIRYFRSICVNYESTFWREKERWPIRNLKLRHSRVLMYAGLFMLIGGASSQEPEARVDYIHRHLHLTPLERLASVYKDARDDNFQRLAGLYDAFLQQISDPEARQKLQAIDYESRFAEPVFVRLKANSEAFVAELSRFLWSRRGTWSDRFFEYMIF